MSEKNSSTIKLDKNSELRRARRTKLFFVFLVLVLVLIGSGVGFLRKKNLQINQVTVTGARSLDPEQVRQSVQSYLNEYYAWVIPKSNALLLSKQQLHAYLLEQVPTLDHVAVIFKDTQHIELVISEKKPSYVWCQESLCYFLDAKGIIYERSPDFTEGIYVTFLGMETGFDRLENPINQSFISPEYFSRIISLLGELQTLGIQPLTVTLADTLTITTSHISGIPVASTTQLIIDPITDNDAIRTTLSLLLTSDPAFKESLVTKGSFLRYIDIRFPDKIYYKFDTPTHLTPALPVKGGTNQTNAQLLEKPQ